MHRSGRTGRAGSKGVSALIVPSSDYKRAQRLLQNAKVVAEWVKAPSADDVRSRDDERMLDHPGLTEEVGDAAPLVAQLLERFGAEQVASAFLKLWREGRPAAEELMETQAPPAPMAPRQPREFGPSVWFTLSVGHSGRAEARWLLPKICDAGGITRDGIGAIRVKQDLSYVQIAADQADRFGDFIEISPEVTMRRMQGEPDLDSAPQPRFDRGDKPARKPAPRSKPADDQGHKARVKAARGGWVPDDAPLADPRTEGPRPPLKAWKKKSSTTEGGGKPAWAAKGKPRADRPDGPKPHRKGPKRPG